MFRTMIALIVVSTFFICGNIIAAVNPVSVDAGFNNPGSSNIHEYANQPTSTDEMVNDRSKTGVDTLWTATIGSDAHDFVEAAKRTDDGGFIFAGSTFARDNQDAYIVRTDSLGDTLWTKIIGGQSVEKLQSVDQTNNGGYVFTGYSTGLGDELGDIILVRANADGIIISLLAYGWEGEDRATCIRETADLGSIAVGWTASDQGEDRDILVMKMDFYGDTLWTKRIGGNDHDEAWSVMETGDGNFVIAGATRSYGMGAYDAWVMELDSSGEMIWDYTHGGETNDYAYCLDSTANGDYIIAGYSEFMPSRASDFMLFKVSRSGSPIWSRIYGKQADEKAHFVQSTDDGGYIVGGLRSDRYSTGNDIHIVKTLANGDTSWTETIDANNSLGYPWNRITALETGINRFMVIGPTGILDASGHDIRMFNIAVDFNLQYNPEDYEFETFGDSLYHREFRVSSELSQGYVKPYSDSNWIGFEPDSAYLQPGDTSTFAVTIDPGLMPFHDYSGEIDFVSNLPGLDGYSIIADIEVNPPIAIEMEILTNPINPGDTLKSFIRLSNPTPQYVSGSFSVYAEYPPDTLIWDLYGPKTLVFFPYGEITGLIENNTPPDIPEGEYQYHVDLLAFPELENHLSQQSMSFIVETVAAQSYPLLRYDKSSKETWDLLYSDFGDFVPQNDFSAMSDDRSDLILFPNYPNPFNAVTEIRYFVSEESRVRIDIYNLSGRMIQTVVNKRHLPGEYSVNWDASDFASGVYFYQLTAGNRIIRNRMALIK
ncbi:MAG: T9SS type A sorting domain-containing protein [candidate division Zixibacteria bacterium]|nr:T9SS type A sorting domain-containing protein [candidate division Zixibacteria bacterium]